MDKDQKEKAAKEELQGNGFVITTKRENDQDVITGIDFQEITTEEDAFREAK